MFKGVRKKQPSVPPALLQHLSPVELIINHQENKTLQYVKEIRTLFPYSSLPFDIQKSSIALFINELLIKSLHEEEANSDLFDFLITSLQILDLNKEPVQNFHLWFALQFTRFLGFLPGEKKDVAEKYFDLQEGVYCSSVPGHDHFISDPHHTYFHLLSRPGFRDYYQVMITNADRRFLLHKIIEYYQLHLQGFGKMKSNEILEEVLSDSL